MDNLSNKEATRILSDMVQMAREAGVHSAFIYVAYGQAGEKMTFLGHGPILASRVQNLVDSALEYADGEDDQ